MRTRRAFLMLAAGSFFVPLASLAEKPQRMRRIGILSSRQRPESLATDTLHGEVPRRLRELGYVEGENLAIEWRFSAGDYDRLASLALELVRLHVEVIVTSGSEGIRAAQSATKTIPIVFMGGADLVASGFVKSLARPGGNTTGVSLLFSDTVGKQVEILAMTVPRLSRLVVLFNPRNPANVSMLESFRAVAETFTIELVLAEAQTQQEIYAAFSLAVKERPDALIWMNDTFLISQARQIAELAAKHRLPAMTGVFEYPDAGGLMSYGVNRTLLFRRVAEYVDKILKGANPGELPVEQPTKLELIINRRTARALGLTIPPELLLQADRVIE